MRALRIKPPARVPVKIIAMNSQDIFNKRICQAVKASTIEVRDTAQEKHRFTSRTGNLEKAVDYRISNSGMQGVVFIDSDVAKYGPFVHAGDTSTCNSAAF